MNDPRDGRGTPIPNVVFYAVVSVEERDGQWRAVWWDVPGGGAPDGTPAKRRFESKPYPCEADAQNKATSWRDVLAFE
jgi:hypothetical protein